MRTEICFGDKCKDVVTGFTGIVTGKLEYINGCVQLLLSPKMKKDGTLAENHWFDIERIEVLQSKKINLVVEPSGGASGREAPPTR